MHQNKSLAEKVCVLLPAFNEAKNIEICLKNTKAAFPEAFILVVDNKSTDNTAELARGLGVTVVTETAKGKGHAVCTGVQIALSKGCDWIALHDADNEYDAFHLAALVWECQTARLQSNSSIMGVGLRDVCLGNVLWRSLIANFVARAALAIATKKTPPVDILTGARVLSADLAKKAFLRAEGQAAFKGFELETGLTRLALTANAHLVYSPVRYSPRSISEKKIKAWDMAHILKAAWGA